MTSSAQQSQQQGWPRRRIQPWQRKGWPLAAAGLVLSVAGCGRSPASPEVVAVDLVAALAEAEVRGDRLDLRALASDRRLEQKGVAGLKPGATVGPAHLTRRRGRVRLPFFSTGDKLLLLRMRALDSVEAPVSVEVSLNDTPLGRLTVDREVREWRLAVASSLQQVGPNRLLLEARRLTRTRARRSPEWAELWLETLPLAGPASPTGLPGLQDGVLVLPGGSSVGYHIRIPAAARLRVRGSGPAGLSVCLEGAAGGRRCHDLTPGEGGEARLDLASRAGEIVRLELANSASQGWSIRSMGVTVPAPSRGGEPFRGSTGASLVVYLVDTLRADRLGAYGYPQPTSPRLDAFVREAVLFENAWAQAPWTRPAVASVFTGLHPSSHGIGRADRVLPDSLPTLAEHLKQQGYRTGAFVANRLLAGRFGFGQGFDTWNGGDDGLYDASAAELGERALRWVDSGTTPFFLYLHTMEPHFPYTPSAEDAAAFGVSGEVDPRELRGLFERGRRGGLTAQEGRRLESLYLGEIRGNDRAFGRLVDGLRSRGFLEKTVVAFTADHGEEFLDHGGTDHAYTLYQEMLHVPLCVRFPGGLRGGRRETRAVQQIDLLPTLLRLLGLPVPSDVDGQDLAPLWLGHSAGEGLSPLLFGEARYSLVRKNAVRADGFKLILNHDSERLWRAGSHLELYDLVADPRERVNLAASHRVALDYLLQELGRFRERKLSHRGVETGDIVLTPEEREALHALGYVE